MPRRSHAPTTAASIGSAASSSTIARRVSWASSLQIVATPPRVGSRIHRVDGAARSTSSTSPASGAVSDRMSASQGQIAPSQHHRHAVIGERARDEHDVARLDEIGAEVTVRRKDADPRGRDVQAVGRTLADHLGVAGDDLDACLCGGGGHVLDDHPELGDLEALLDDEGNRQPRRARPHHGKVVDRPVDGEVPDRAAREVTRLHHEGVRAERQSLAGRQRRRGCVDQRCSLAGRERIDEHRVDQRRRRLAPGTMRQRDHVVDQTRSPAAERFDAVQHGRFTIVGHARPPPSVPVAVPVSRRSGAPAPGATARTRVRPAPPGCDARCRRRRRGSVARGPIAPSRHRRSRRCRSSGARDRAAVANAIRRLRELPLVDNPTAMSPACAWAISWRENTRSKPTSLPSAVSTAPSSPRWRAATGRPTEKTTEEVRQRCCVARTASVAEEEHPPTRLESLGDRRLRLPRAPGRSHRPSSPEDGRWRRPWPSPTERDRRAERSHPARPTR